MGKLNEDIVEELKHSTRNMQSILTQQERKLSRFTATPGVHSEKLSQNEKYDLRRNKQSAWRRVER